MTEFIYGHWGVLETLRANRRQADQLILASGIQETGTVADIVKHAQSIGIPIKSLPRRILNDLANGSNHQGTVLRVTPYPYADIDQVLQTASDANELPLLLLLDLLKDPQNVGVLMRTAETVGVHGVFLQDRRSVRITPSVVNASAGAVEHINVVQVTNLVQTMKTLKTYDIWLIGMETEQHAAPIDQADLDIALGIVLGSEGQGMRRLVKDTCDMLLNIPMRGKISSLNVTAAGTVALYMAWQARKWHGWKYARPPMTKRVS